jgi:hypothetical protein
MAKKPKTAVILCIHSMILFCLVSCGGQLRFNVPSDQVYIAPPEKTIPLKAGLYLSQAFRTTQSPYIIRGGKYGDVFAGNAVSSGAEKMVRNLFQEVTVLDPIGNASTSTVQNYDVIVTPQVEQFEYRHFDEFFSGHHKTLIAIKWRIVSPDGKELYQNTIKSDEIKATWDERYHPEVIIPVAIKDQFKKAQEDIYSSGWWKKQWWKDGN